MAVTARKIAHGIFMDPAVFMHTVESRLKIWRNRWSVIQTPLSEIYAGNVLDYTVFRNPADTALKSTRGSN